MSISIYMQDVVVHLPMVERGTNNEAHSFFLPFRNQNNPHCMSLECKMILNYGENNLPKLRG